MNKSIKNYVYQTTYQLLIVLTPILTAPYLARILGTEGIGIYSYTHNTANYFLMFSMLGVANYGARCIAKNRGNVNELNKTFWSIYICQVLCAFVMLILYLIYLVCVCDVDIVISALQVLLIFSGCFDVCWFFRGLENFEIIIKRNIVVKISIVVSIFLFVKLRSDVWKYVIIMSGGTLLSQILIWSQVRKCVRFVIPEFSSIVSHIKPNFILFLPEITSCLYNSIDKLMIGRMVNMSELGIYENTEKLTSIPTSLITSLGVVLLPRITYLLSSGAENKVKKIFNYTFTYVCFLGIGLIFGLVGISSVFVPVFFGIEFLDICTVLPYLAPSIFFMCVVTNIRSQVLLPHGMDKEYLMSTIIGAVTNIVVNLLLIPRYGAKGAAIATLIAYIALFAFQMVIASSFVDLKGNIIRNIPFILFGFIMCLTIRNIYFYSDMISVFLKIIVGGIEYSVLSFLYVFFFTNDLLREFKAIFKSKKDN